MRKVRARLGAARVLLQGASERHDKLSSQQSAALLACVQSVELTDDEKTEVIELCMAVPWESNDHEQILNFLTVLPEPKKRKGQDA